jgi:hypothetical protein
MITIEREEFKSDIQFRRVFESIKRSHKIPQHTIDVFKQNPGVKDLCEESLFYVQMGNVKPIYLSYKASHWLKDERVIMRVEHITFYDDAMEYQIERSKGIHSQDPGNFPERN